MGTQSSAHARRISSLRSHCDSCEAGELALRLMQEMKRHGLIPNVITYGAAISACEKGKNSELALQFLREMRASELSPNLISYSAAIGACEKGMQWAEALSLLREMCDRGPRPNR